MRKAVSSQTVAKRLTGDLASNENLKKQMSGQPQRHWLNNFRRRIGLQPLKMRSLSETVLSGRNRF